MELDHEPSTPSLTRHIVPVAAGGAVWFLLTAVTDNAVTAHGWGPVAGEPAKSTGALLLVGSYRALFAILGCHLAARLAPPGNPRIRYALGLGFLLLAATAVAAVSSWGQVPTWYSLGSIAATIPCAILGGATGARAMVLREQR